MEEAREGTAATSCAYRRVEEQSQSNSGSKRNRKRYFHFPLNEARIFVVKSRITDKPVTVQAYELVKDMEDGIPLKSLGRKYRISTSSKVKVNHRASLASSLSVPPPCLNCDIN